MMPSTSTPKLPLWIFILTDVALLLAGLLIAARSSAPLSSTAVFSIVACVIAGAVVLFVPLVSHIEREKNDALDDRQRALEALAATVATSAEQLSIAAQGLHESAELAQKNLRLAEQLPAKFQDKIAEFETLLNNAQADEREELKKELAQLRASESERLEAIANKVDHASTELTKLEATAQKHLSTAQAALARVPEAISSATAAALVEIESKLAARATRAAPPAAAPQDEPRRSPRSEGGPYAAKSPARATEEGTHIIPVVPPTTAPFIGDVATTALEVTAPPFAGNIVSTEPVKALLSSTAAANEGASAVEASATETATGEPKVARKPRAPRKPKTNATEPALALGTDEPATPAADEFNQSAPDESPKANAEVVENVISSDGATRLLVTAYIGIGNRLFIRGDGPGLSWDKGVPLQFVSIGKWRWETDDTTGPVKFKLYKNDEIECTALGSQALNPGHQQEITAAF